MMYGCMAKPKTPTIQEKTCPHCGSLIEMFSIDTQMACEKCGFIAYNDTLSCVQWCEHAKECVGEEMYNHMIAIAEQNKRKRKENAA
jgi:ribosomal protein S27AE